MSFHFHISRLNYKYCSLYKAYLSTSLGCITEIFPISVIGFSFGSINLLSKINHLQNFLCIIMPSIIYIFFQYDIFIFQKGFGYPDILLNSSASLALFLLFSSIPFGLIKTDKIKNIIKLITQYTGGIYYIHVIIRDYLRRHSIYFRQSSYFCSFFIYIISYLNCFFGNKIFNNSKLKYLFI